MEVGEGEGVGGGGDNERKWRRCREVEGGGGRCGARVGGYSLVPPYPLGHSSLVSFIALRFDFHFFFVFFSFSTLRSEGFKYVRRGRG